MASKKDVGDINELLLIIKLNEDNLDISSEGEEDNDTSFDQNNNSYTGETNDNNSSGV